MNERKLKVSTLAIHGGHGEEEITGAVMYPIFQTSTFAQKAPGVHKGYEYSRTKNPTRTVLEKLIATLEGGMFGYAFSSGSAATSSLLHLFSSGDHIICSDDCYGGTFRLFSKVFTQYGLEYSMVDLTNIEQTASCLQKNTKAIWIETPTNPMLKIIDLDKIISWGHDHSLLVIVDNTFMSPVLQLPLKYGADIIVHSTTKYINGHSDVIGGALITNQEKIAQKIAFMQNAIGAVPGPMDVWLTIRGIKTLPIRMRAHCENAMKLATFLESHLHVEKVIYPGLKSHPEHEIAKKQMSAFGGMLSFYLKSSGPSYQDFFKRLSIITLAESLGGVESLCEHPATMTHASLPPEHRNQLGITDQLIRISVGIEDIDDLIYDISGALG